MTKYDDILSFTRPRSMRHRPMPVENRAAQFAPFAALHGHDAAIEETARLTDEEMEADECVLEVINRRLCLLADRINDLPTAVFTCFVPDARKRGGSYVQITGRVLEVNEVEKYVELTDGTRFPMGHIYAIESELFDDDR